MKKNTIIALLLAFSSFTWLSCQKEEIDEPIVEQPVEDKDPWSKDNNSLFWKISGNGLKQPAHLFGTIHLIPENDLAFGDKLDALVDASTSLMLEINIEDPKIIQAAQSRMKHKPGEAPEQYFSADELEQVKNLCKAVGTPWASLKHLNLMSIESYISQQILKNDMGISKGYEHYLVEEAKKTETPIAGAEGADYVYTYQNDIKSEDVAVRLLEVAQKYLNDKEAYLAEYNEMLQTYLAQDLRNLHFKSFEENKDLYTALVAQRNLAWMDALEDNLDGKLIAVGAGHLGGKQGLVYLLRAQGYEVTAIKVAQ